MNRKDAVLAGLAIMGCIVLGSFLLLLDPAIHARFLEAVDATGRGIEMLFYAGLGLGSAAIGVKIWRGRTALVIKDGKDGQVARAVVYRGQVVQIGSAEGIGLNEILQMQAQLLGQQQKTLQVVDSGAKAFQRLMTIQEEYDDEYEEEDDVKLLEAPKVHTLSEQLQSMSTQINEDTSIVGYVDDEPLRGKLFDNDGNIFDSVFVLGDPGFGKSTFATYLAALTVMHHGRLIVIDPDAEFGQSLSVRLGPLANEIFLLCPIADTPEKAERALDIAEAELESPSDYPVLFLIDEFTMIMRQAANDSGKWNKVGKRLADITENYATRGRKRERRVVAFGQIPNAKRSGGTEFRDSCTVVTFHLKKRRATMVLEVEEAEEAPTLKAGEVIVIPARSSESSYRMQLPMPDNDGLRMIAHTMANMASEAISRPLENSFDEMPDKDLKLPGKILEIPPEMAFMAKVRRVREMRQQGKNQSQIIDLLYGVTPGGSTEYARARDEYRSIMQIIASEDAQEGL